MAQNVKPSTDLVQSVAVRRLKLLLLCSSLIAIIFLVAAAYQENFGGAWRGYQRAYRADLAERAGTEPARRAARQMPIEFRQLYLPELNRIERCVTCHVGVDDPGQAGAALPLRTHSGRTLTQHPPEKFGCTDCHDGQGRATNQMAAHGDAESWPQPLLRGELIFTSCGRCHYENDLFGAEYELHAEAGPLPSINQAELSWTLPGAPSPNEHAVGRGKQLVLAHGCIGCHQYRNRGGEVGRDITHEGDNTVHDFDFTHVQGARTVEQWLFEHFKKPGAITPGTVMPDMGFTDQQAQDLTLYMLSLHRKRAPAALTPVPPLRSNEPASSKQLYGMLCSACHGQEGRGSHYFDDRNTAIPALRFLAERLQLLEADQAKAAASLLRQGTDLKSLAAKPPFDGEVYPEFVKQVEVMRDVIRKGRHGVKKNASGPLEPVNMPSWRQTLTDRQIDAILADLIDLYPFKE